MKIIFLDIDGVLNCQQAYNENECQYKQFFVNGLQDNYSTFYSQSKHFLNILIRQTDAKIVISSTWRSSGIDFMREVWKEEKMEGEIIGITPNFRGDIKGYTIPRGCEIDYYLKENLGFYHINWNKEEQLKRMRESGVENYIIIDDDSDMLYGQKNHFIHVLPSPRNLTGFNAQYHKKALETLSKNIIDINFGN